MKKYLWFVLLLILVFSVFVYAKDQNLTSLPQFGENDLCAVIYDIHKPEDKDCEIYINGNTFRFFAKSIFMVNEKAIDGCIHQYVNDITDNTTDSSNFLRTVKREGSGWPYIISKNIVKVFIAGNWYIFIK